MDKLVEALASVADKIGTTAAVLWPYAAQALWGEAAVYLVVWVALLGTCVPAFLHFLRVAVNSATATSDTPNANEANLARAVVLCIVCGLIAIAVLIAMATNVGDGARALVNPQGALVLKACGR